VIELIGGDQGPRAHPDLRHAALVLAKSFMRLAVRERDDEAKSGGVTEKLQTFLSVND